MRIAYAALSVVSLTFASICTAPVAAVRTRILLAANGRQFPVRRKAGPRTEVPGAEPGLRPRHCLCRW